MASIALIDVSKASPTGHVAVRDLSLEIESGELLVLVGPSGSGKSTVLRMIAGLELPTSGQVLFDGEDMTFAPPQRREVAMVFQSYALYPHMTVRENLAFGLKLRGTGASDIDAAVRKTADMLDIAGLLDRKPSQLSGGQRQRVAVGRALARAARAYLLDEPLSNLDPLLRVETRTELGLLHRQLGATMVYVTHDQEEAMTLGTRIAVMRDGRIEQIGGPLDLYRRPDNLFVAQFVGSPAANVCRAACAAADGGWRITSDVCSGVLDSLDHRAAVPERVDLAFRPQDVDIVSPGDADFSGRVAVVEPLGPTTLLHVKAGAAERLVRVVAPGEFAVRVDDVVGLRVRRERVHVFDAETGRRVN